MGLQIFFFAWKKANLFPKKLFFHEMAVFSLKKTSLLGASWRNIFFKMRNLAMEFHDAFFSKRLTPVDSPW